MNLKDGIRNSDLIASSSLDDYINFYKVDLEKKNIENLQNIYIPNSGSINNVLLRNTGHKGLLICTHSKDHRMGRWYSLKTTPGISIYSVFT